MQATYTQPTKMRIVFNQEDQICKAVAEQLIRGFNYTRYTDTSIKTQAQDAMEIEQPVTGRTPLVICLVYHGTEDYAKLDIRKDPAITAMADFLKKRNDLELKTIFLLSCLGGAGYPPGAGNMINEDAPATKLFEYFNTPVVTSDGIIGVEPAVNNSTALRLTPQNGAKWKIIHRAPHGNPIVETIDEGVLEQYI